MMKTLVKVLVCIAMVLMLAGGASAFTAPNAIGNIFMPVDASVASATSIVPTGAIFPLTGTTSCTLISIPYVGWTGVIIMIPAGAASFATGGTATGLSYPIGASFTASANVPIVATFNGSQWFLK
jgi:hypothetical protein